MKAIRAYAHVPVMGEREEYLAKAIEAERLAADTAIGVLRDALIEMAKSYRRLAYQTASASEAANA